MPDIRIVTATKFRDLAFPNRSFLDTPRSPQSLIPYLKSAQFQERIAPLRIRYLIILDIEDWTYGRHIEVATGSGTPLWAFGQEWERSVQIEAVVFDIKEGWESGKVTSSSTGKSGAVIPVCLCIPLFPIPYSPAQGSRACHELGKTLAIFIAGRYETEPLSE